MFDRAISYAQMLAEIRAEFPRFSIQPKESSRVQRLISWLLIVLTFGVQRHYMTEYRTVLGSTLWVPPSWWQEDEYERTVVLAHERIHLRQQRRYGRVLFSVLYLLPILPIGLAIGRALLEWEAYRETIACRAKIYGIESIENARFQAQIVRQFTSGLYGWMWPFPWQIRAWLRQAIDDERQKRKRADDDAPCTHQEKISR